MALTVVPAKHVKMHLKNQVVPALTLFSASPYFIQCQPLLYSVQSRFVTDFCLYKSELIFPAMADCDLQNYLQKFLQIWSHGERAHCNRSQLTSK